MLQNRVTPFGDLMADPARGLLMGNRGGRFHRDDRTLGARRFASRQWICCRLSFEGRHRDVWGSGYTELFFLDEPTAFAAGHRPCFECRRQEAEAFASSFPPMGVRGVRPRASQMDAVLHEQRRDAGGKRRHRFDVKDLPDGAFVTFDGSEAFAVRGSRLLRWTPSGYGERRGRPRSGVVDVLTPPSILAVLAAGYRPFWHPSANNPDGT